MDLSSLVLKALAPAFGDMDADGDQDMVIGEYDGWLHYFENTAGAGNLASFAAPLIRIFGIDVGQFSAPFIYDINGDSIPDLVVGEKLGNINYLENIGTASVMQFDTFPTNSFFGEIDVRIPFSGQDGNATPVLTMLDSTGEVYLVSGCHEGNIRVYSIDPDAIYGGKFKRIFNRYSDIDEGTRTAPSIADLTGDGKYEMVVGNYRGGIGWFSQSDSLVYPDPISARGITAPGIEMLVYPNPAKTQVFITLNGFMGNEPVVITLLDMLGREIMGLKTSVQQNVLELPKTGSGMYFLRAQQGGAAITKKLLIAGE